MFSALVHAWDSGSHVDADIEEKPMIINGEDHDVKYVKVKGAIFFSSVGKFVNMFNVVEDPKMIIIDFEYALVIDHSAVAAIQGITQRFAKVGKKVLLINLGKKCHGRLHRTGDHGVLRHQITPAVHVVHPEESTSSSREDHDVEGEPVPDARPLSPSTADHEQHHDGAAAAATTTTTSHDQQQHPHYHYNEISHFIEDLPMFSPGVDEIEIEVEHLLGQQTGDYSIHEKKTK